MLAIQLPAGYTFDESVGVQPSAMLQGPPVIEPLTRIAHIPLDYSKPGPFKLTMEGYYAPVDVGPPLILGLPKPQGTLDRGATVTIQLPENLEFVAPKSDDSVEREIITQEPHRLSWSYRRYPSKVEVHWQPFRSELFVRTVADLAVAGHQVRVRQRFWFESSGSHPRKAVLQVPRSSADSLQLKEGGALEWPLSRGATLCPVILEPNPGKEGPLVVDYVFAIPENPAIGQTSQVMVPLDARRNARSRLDSPWDRSHGNWWVLGGT